MPLPARLRPLIDAARGRYVRAGARLERWLRGVAPGRVLHPRTLADRALARRLARTFERDLADVDVSGVRFFVYNGTVALYGAVAHPLDHDVLTALVRGVPGVRGIVSHVYITDGQSPARGETAGA